MNKVLVVTAKGDAYLANHVITTVSIKYLKNHHQDIFTPPLPSDLTDAYEVSSMSS